LRQQMDRARYGIRPRLECSTATAIAHADIACVLLERPVETAPDVGAARRSGSLANRP